MTTANTTTTKKAFALSLAFHTFMALCALWILSAPPSPPEPLALPLKHITLVSLSQASALTPPATVPVTPKMQKVLPETPRPQAVPPSKPVPQKSPDHLPDAPPAAPKTLPTADPAPSPADTKPSVLPAAAPAPVQPQTQPRKTDTSAEMNALKTSLRSRIQQQLRYPAPARRRGMEGSVPVRFLLGADGAIRNITVLGGEGIFHNAVKLAVAAASGIEIAKNLKDSLPIELELTLEFKLSS
jgi:protein TonB